MSDFDELDRLLTRAPQASAGGPATAGDDALQRFVAILADAARGPAPVPSASLAAFLDHPGVLPVSPGSPAREAPVGAEREDGRSVKRGARRLGWSVRVVMGTAALVLAGTGAFAAVRHVTAAPAPTPTPTPSVTSAPPVEPAGSGGPAGGAGGAGGSRTNAPHDESQPTTGSAHSVPPAPQPKPGARHTGTGGASGSATGDGHEGGASSPRGDHPGSHDGSGDGSGGTGGSGGSGDTGGSGSGDAGTGTGTGSGDTGGSGSGDAGGSGAGDAGGSGSGDAGGTSGDGPPGVQDPPSPSPRI